MSNFTRKGYTTIKAVDRRTGRPFTASIAVGGRTHKAIERDKRKFVKARRAEVRSFKARLKAAKKEIPIEVRATVNWSELAHMGEQS